VRHAGGPRGGVGTAGVGANRVVGCRLESNAEFGRWCGHRGSLGGSGPRPRVGCLVGGIEIASASFATGGPGRRSAKHR
jgi:hypothetical protein